MRSSLSEAQVRARVEAQEGLIPQGWWEYLVEHWGTDDAQTSERGMARVTQHVRDLKKLGAWGQELVQLGTGASTRAFEPLMIGQGREREDARVMRIRGDIFSKYIAKKAGQFASVLRFRAEYLEGA